ncbi:MAG: hypothetical protein ABSE42_07925 [Bryobacteraceae bacterium]
MPISTTAGMKICGAVLGVALAALPLAAADKETAPVPAQIPAARKVFLSNAGVDGMALTILKRAGDSDQPYNQVYAAMKSWGGFEMVGAPSDADLILEVRFSVQLSDCGKLASYQPLLALTILDSKTHFILWTIAEPVEGAVLAKTWEKNIGQGIANLVADLKSLAARPDAGGGTKQ